MKSLVFLISAILLCVTIASSLPSPASEEEEIMEAISAVLKRKDGDMIMKNYVAPGAIYVYQGAYASFETMLNEREKQKAYSNGGFEEIVDRTDKIGKDVAAIRMHTKWSNARGQEQRRYSTVVLSKGSGRWRIWTWQMTELK